MLNSYNVAMSGPFLALQMAMAFPSVGKPRRPMTLLLAWRMKDMLAELDSFCMDYDTVSHHGTQQAAYVACQGAWHQHFGAVSSLSCTAALSEQIACICCCVT